MRLFFSKLFQHYTLYVTDVRLTIGTEVHRCNILQKLLPHSTAQVANNFEPKQGDRHKVPHQLRTWTEYGKRPTRLQDVSYQISSAN